MKSHVRRGGTRGFFLFPWHLLKSLKKVLTEVLRLRTRDVVALEHAPPLALRRPLSLVVSVQH